MNLRPATPHDVDLVKRTLYTALAWDPDDPIPPFDQVVAHPQIAIYHEGWMREGDAGVVAEVAGAFAGMAYCRTFPPGTSAQGWVDEETPELAVGVEDAHRGQGLGTSLIETLHVALRTAGTKQISLSVINVNPAKRIYERLGYQIHEETERESIMVLDLTRDDAP